MLRFVAIRDPKNFKILALPRLTLGFPTVGWKMMNRRGRLGKCRKPSHDKGKLSCCPQSCGPPAETLASAAAAAAGAAEHGGYTGVPCIPVMLFSCFFPPCRPGAEFILLKAVFLPALLSSLMFWFSSNVALQNLWDLLWKPTSLSRSPPPPVETSFALLMIPHPTS